MNDEEKSKQQLIDELTDLKKREAEREYLMAQTEARYQISRKLNVASSEDDILHILTETAIEAGGVSANLQYMDLDEAGNPEWLTVVAAWHRDNTPSAVGTRYSLSELSSAKLWMDNPDKVYVVEDVTTDEGVDKTTHDLSIQMGILAWIVLPMFYANRWVGALSITWDHPHKLSEYEKEFYQDMISLASSSVANFRTIQEHIRLQKELVEAQKRAIEELSTPVIPIMDRIIVLPLIGSIDSMRARDITRSLLAGITQHRAKIVIVDVTGVSIMDTGIVNHLNKTIQAARLKGAHTIVTGISDSVAEAIVDLGIDWSEITTLSDLQTGLLTALSDLGVKLS